VTGRISRKRVVEADSMKIELGHLGTFLCAVLRQGEVGAELLYADPAISLQYSSCVGSQSSLCRGLKRIG
jgi:hypothetical protein